LKKINKYLLLGPLIHQEEVGGVVVLFDNLLKKLDELNINYIVVDTNKKNYKNTVIAVFSIYFQIIKNIKLFSHISLHGTANDYIAFGPFLMLLSALSGKSYSLRKFAGNYDEIYSKYNFLQKKLVNIILKFSSANFFETKYLVDYFCQYNKNTYWFPNVREKQTFITSDVFKKKIVYLGTISKEKGIDILFDIADKLDSSFNIDLYGPLDDNYSVEKFQKSNLNYKGIIKHENVTEILKDYNILMLPSYREGYPGVIVEAFSVGLPIVATNLQGIKEMVNEQAALLFDVGNTKQLLNILNSMTSEMYLEMRIASLERFSLYDSNIQTKNYLQRLEQL